MARISLCSGIGRRLFSPTVATVGSLALGLLFYMNRLMILDLLQKFTQAAGIASTTTNEDNSESSRLNLHYNLLGETAARLLQSPRRGFFDESECNLGNRLNIIALMATESIVLTNKRPTKVSIVF